MTAQERKRLGKYWKLMDAAKQSKFPQYEKYHDEFKEMIDSEIAGGNLN